MALAMEMVQHQRFDVVQISFMITGHTKLSVDQVYSRTAQSYNCSDVFTIAELGNIAEPYYCSVQIETDLFSQSTRMYQELGPYTILCFLVTI